MPLGEFSSCTSYFGGKSEGNITGADGKPDVMDQAYCFFSSKGAGRRLSINAACF